MSFLVWREEESVLQKGKRICKGPEVRRSKALSRCTNSVAGTESGKFGAIGWKGPNVQSPTRGKSFCLHSESKGMPSKGFPVEIDMITVAVVAVRFWLGDSLGEPFLTLGELGGLR